jgi:hypothetical protein
MRRYRLPHGHPLRSAGKPVQAAYVDMEGDLAHTPDLTVYETSEPWIAGNIIDPNTMRRVAYYIGPDPIGFLPSMDEDDADL